MPESRREKIRRLFNGRTIKEVECRYENKWWFYFTDGSIVELDIEPTPGVWRGLTSLVPYDVSPGTDATD